MTLFQALRRPMLPVLLLLLSTVLHAQAPASGDLIYTVRQGDTLEQLAERLMEQPRRYTEVARLNRLRDNDLLSPGQTLRFPAALLKMQPVEGTVTAVKGQVTLNGQAAANGARVPGRTTVNTGADGLVTIKLADGSELRLQSDSTLEVSELKGNPASGARAARLNLKKGRVVRPRAMVRASTSPRRSR